MMDGEIIKAERLFEKVERILAKEIAKGVYDSEGYLPSERSLMARFNVGRPAIREAIFSLECRGLAIRQVGKRVKPVRPGFDTILNQLDLVVESSLRTQNDLLQFLEVRVVLECGLARKAAQSATEDQKAELKTIIENSHTNIHDQEAFWSCDAQFHEKIAQISGNAILPVMIKAIARWLISERRITVADIERNEIVCRQHEAVLDAICAGDGDRAFHAMEQHFDDTKRVLGLDRLDD